MDGTSGICTLSDLINLPHILALQEEGDKSY